MRPDSIRFRLSAWYAGVLCAVCFALGALLYFHLKDYLENVLLETQARRAQQIGATLIAGLGPGGEAALGRQIEALYAPEKSERFIRITRDDGALVYLSGHPAGTPFDPGAVPPPTPPFPRERVRRQPTAGRSELLIAAVRVAAANGSRYLVEVGVSAQPVEALFNHVLAVLLGLGLPGAVAIAAGGAYLLVGRALKPVEQITGKASLITQHNLSERLPVARTGDELERLSISLNRMITRLDDAFQNSKRFVADASHELRTPLTVLRGELEALAQDETLAPEPRERLGSLLEEVERLSRIVEQLLALSRLDAGEAQVEWVRFDLAELAEETAGQMMLLAKDRAISVACRRDGPVLVHGDRARLKQVVVNLLDNAIKYTPSGGSVEIRAAAAGGGAVLEVRDTGPGISPEALPHLFERFYRANRGQPGNPDGAGLGLAIVKAVCSAHGGGVSVHSEQGRGTRFRVTLPAAPV